MPLFYFIFFVVNASLLVVIACAWILFPTCTDPYTSNEEAGRTKGGKEEKEAAGMCVNLCFSVPKNNYVSSHHQQFRGLICYYKY